MESGETVRPTDIIKSIKSAGIVNEEKKRE